MWEEREGGRERRGEEAGGGGRTSPTFHHHHGTNPCERIPPEMALASSACTHAHASRCPAEPPFTAHHRLFCSQLDFVT